jgi:hypothetical protein
MPARIVSKPYVRVNRPNPSALGNGAEDEPDPGEDLGEDEIKGGADIPDDMIDTDDGVIG